MLEREVPLNKSNRFFRKLYNILYYIFSILFVCITAVFFVFYYYGNDLPSELTLLNYAPLTTSRIYDADGKLMEEYAIERRTVLPFDKIPMLVKGAFLIAEDKDFYSHGGVSLQGFLRAVIENTARKGWNKKPTGGSTITQQVAKNLLVGNARTLRRKIREAIMAFRIESSLTKDKILEIYLNQLYLGKGCYGVSAACEYYFGKNITNATPAEVAFIASVPSIPNVYINNLDSKKLRIKMNSILYQLYDLGYISKEQLKIAISTPIKINKVSKAHKYPYYSDEIFKLISQRVSKEAFFKCGYQVTTAMNATVQYIATKALEDGLIQYTKRYQVWKSPKFTSEDLTKIQNELPHTINTIVPCKIMNINSDGVIAINKDGEHISVKFGSYNNALIHKGDIILAHKTSDGYELYMQPEVTGGIIVMNASNGDVLAMVGGYSFDISTFNCVTQARRQPGSAIKPFVYATALEIGMNECDVISDEPTKVTLSNGQIYVPKNYDNKYLGKIELRDGLILSRNTATVNLAQAIGMHEVNHLLVKLGLTNKRVPISAVLGAIDVVPIKLLSAFSIFVNDGKMVKPRFIKHISQFNEQYANKSLTSDLTKSFAVQVISPQTANTMRAMLHDVIHYGTATQLAELEDQFNIEIIGKTGSTNNWKDAWFIGAVTKNNRTLLIGVFVGFPIPKSLGHKAYGATVAIPIFKLFVTNLFSGTLTI